MDFDTKKINWSLTSKVWEINFFPFFLEIQQIQQENYS